MNKFVALACLLIATVACGKQPSTTDAPSTPPADTADTAQAPAQSESAPAQTPQNTAPAEQESVDAGEQLEETDKDTPVTTRANTQLAAAIAPAPTEPASRWQQGVNYQVLVPAQPTSAPPDKVEVVEMFWYGCAHCYALEPYLDRWSEKKPPYIQFTRVPVTWGPPQRAHAKLFYVLEVLGKGPELHRAVFQEIQDNGNQLIASSDGETERRQMEFLKRHGVSEADYRKAASSMAVDTKLRRAEELTRRYRADSVPLMVINGKYTADVSSAQGANELIALVSDLAAREQKRP